MDGNESFQKKPALQKQYSFDDCLYRQSLHITAREIRRSISEIKESTRTLGVSCMVKPKMMVELKLTPKKTPSPEIFHQFDIDIKGADCTKLGTPKDFEKSRKVFFDSQKDIEDIVVTVKESEKEIEHFPFVKVLKIQPPSALKCNKINLTTSLPKRKLPDIRLFNNEDGFLCEKEKTFLKKRKVFIHSALKRLLHKENEFLEVQEDVPHIALIGSGGGYRAMVAMSGIFNAFYDTGLLDVILYTAVLSGSSWYIATLYSHPSWPGVDPREIQKKMRDDISRNPQMWKKFLYYGPWYFFKYLTNPQKYNFTLDVFADILGRCLIEDRMDSKWSDQAEKVFEGTVPLPLLAAIHAKPQQNAREFHEWVEFSPFEASIPKYGAAISMKHLGSKFLKGQLVQEEEKELPLYQIMGICGSAYTATSDEIQEKAGSNSKSVQTKGIVHLTDKCGKESRLYHNATDERNISMLKKEMSTYSGPYEPDWRHGTEIANGTNRNNSECNKDETYPSNCKRKDSTSGFDELDGPSNYGNRKDSRPVDEYPESDDRFDLQDDPHNSSNNSHKYDEIDEILHFKSYLTEQDESHWPKEENIEELKNMFPQFCEIPNDVCPVQENYCDRNDQTGNDAKDEVDGRFCDRFFNNRDTFKRAACINNFLRNVSFDEYDGNPQNSTLLESYLKNENLETLRLIDAGLAFNSPYPLLFKAGRDIDLILSFDFTDRKADKNSPFKTLLEAEDWARTHAIKFPKIKDSIHKYEGKKIQELYVFEEEKDVDCPIIMHFVLVNNKFRHYKKPNVRRDEGEKEFADFNIYDDQSTFHCMTFHYTHQNFDRLSQLSEFIVLNNQEEIKKCIKKSASNKLKRLFQMRRSRHPTK